MLASSLFERNHTDFFSLIRSWWNLPIITRRLARMTEQVFSAVAAAGDIPEKSFSTFEVHGEDIAICRVNGEYFAFENRCSHALAHFDNGRLRGFRIMCPLHGATFDVRTGSCTGAPATRPIRTFALRIIDGMIEVALPCEV